MEDSQINSEVLMERKAKKMSDSESNYSYNLVPYDPFGLHFAESKKNNKIAQNENLLRTNEVEKGVFSGVNTPRERNNLLFDSVEVISKNDGNPKTQAVKFQHMNALINVNFTLNLDNSSPKNKTELVLPKVKFTDPVAFSKRENLNFRTPKSQEKPNKEDKKPNHLTPKFHENQKLKNFIDSNLGLLDSYESDLMQSDILNQESLDFSKNDYFAKPLESKINQNDKNLKTETEINKKDQKSNLVKIDNHTKEIIDLQPINNQMNQFDSAENSTLQFGHLFRFQNSWDSSFDFD